MHTISSPTVSQDSPEYLGRLVISYSRVYTVVRTRQSYGRPELFIATPEGQDGRPYGQWVPAHVIAEPYRTIIHWHPNTEFREDQSSCEALYQSVLQANEVRAQEQAKADQERRERESRCEAFWKEHTPEWAKGYLVAELREDESDIMTDYFAHSVTRRVLLGFSKSDRNNFREIRKLAATFGPTKKLATEGQENRENYTGGSGYYLSGPYRHSGWTIRKESLKYGLPRGSQAVLDVAHWLETASR